MGRLNSRHLDARRTLSPRDYLTDPFAFGERSATPCLPIGGDEISLRIAVQQHRLVLAWRHHGGSGPGELCRLYGIHRNTWANALRGRRWAGETILAALLYGLTRPARPHE
jgi:hypothetical protein